MLDPVLSEDEILSSEIIIQALPGAHDALETRANPENKPVLNMPATPVASQIRIILLNRPEKNPAPRLPAWLHELVGWGVFLFLLGAFLSLQINLSQLISAPGSQVLIILTVLAEIALLWGWDQYWY